MFNRLLTVVFILTTAIVLMITTDVAKAQIVEDGLVSYWGFNSIIDGTVRDTRGSNHGKVMGDTNLVQGKIFNGLQFDGDGDYVDCGNDPSIIFDRNDAFSVGAWVKIDKDHDNHMIIIGKMLSYGSYRGWALWFRGLSIDQELHIDCVQIVIRNHMWEDNGGIMLRGDNPIPRGEWVHLAMTYDGSGTSEGTEMYVNGALHPMSGSENVSKTIKVNSNLTIGARGPEKKGQMHLYFRGIIDEAFVYNRVLKGSEVKQIFEAIESYAVESADKLTGAWGVIKVSK